MREEIVCAAAENFAAFYQGTARAMGKRLARFGDLVVTDFGSPATIINGSVLVKPADPAEFEGFAVSAIRFYAEAPGGGFIFWSMGDRPDFARLGFKGPFPEPVLVLEPGFAEPAPPHGLDIVEARDAATIAAFERALIEGTPIKALQPATPGAVWSEEVLAAEGFHAYVGLCDGRPVTCSAVMIAAGYNGIYAVATLPEFRRRGFGEAMTRRAARADPSLPAVLEASPAGRPLYERMGFEHAGELVTWEMASR